MTAIEWTDATWNPVTGCDRVSPGCANCYALTLAARLKAMGQARYQRDGDAKTSGPGFGITLHHDKLTEPLRWREPRMVFVNSMSDLFHEEIPSDYIENIFVTMARAPQHTFQVLTKRPERALELLSDPGSRNYIVNHATALNTSAARVRGWTGMVEGAQPAWPLPNVWIGVSIENARFTWRADVLREIPAAVRFISAEPLLGSLFAAENGVCGTCGHATFNHGHHGCEVEVSDWGTLDCTCERQFAKPLDLKGIDWLIAGGESGDGHRPIEAQWVRELRDACHADDPTGCYCDGQSEDCIGQCHTAFFFKQWGGRTPKAGGRILDGRVWSDYPERHKVRSAA